LVAAARFERVTGVEISPAAVERARANAERNGLHHVEILHGRAEDVFAPLEGKGGEVAVLVDPPRKGCGPDFMEQAAELAPARLVYVSCNPETQVKDLGILLERGYRLESVQPFDLFPQTRHVETVATLVRKT
jgi:23S rRNA (uracil1939-C5)-methyltransferase/tRNA (uracil-5-)-methyltransferase